MTGFSTAILCGGLSRRMGEDKASLNWKGMPLARYKWEQFRIRKITGRDADAVADVPAGCGPLGGLRTSLQHCRQDYLFVTAVDMPYSDPGIAEELMNRMTSPSETGPAQNGSDRTWDAVVPVTPDGKEHPLCAVYAKSCLPVLEKQLASGNRTGKAACKR